MPKTQKPLNLSIDPALAAAAAKASQRTRSRTPDIHCDQSGCDFIGRSKPEMAEHLIDEHPTGVFGPDKQDEYISLILVGTGRHTAARKTGLSPSTVERFISVNPAFGRAVNMAEEEYVERIEQKLYDAGINGEPWAVKEVLSKRNSKRWGTVPQEIKVSHSVDIKGELNASPQMQRVSQILQDLNTRALMASTAPEIIDAEIVDEQEN